MLEKGGKVVQLTLFLPSRLNPGPFHATFQPRLVRLALPAMRQTDVEGLDVGMGRSRLHNPLR